MLKLDRYARAFPGSGFDAQVRVLRIFLKRL